MICYNMNGLSGDEKMPGTCARNRPRKDSCRVRFLAVMPMKRNLLLLTLFLITSFAIAKPLPRLAPPAAALSGSRVLMETSEGKIVIELYTDKAPLTTANFLTYVDDRFFDGTIFHRVIPDFMIQGGGLQPGMREKPGRAPVKNEAANGLSNERGTLAAARTNVPDSATSQFFINVKDNKFLDRANSPDKVGYTVFGRVVEGMDVVDRITQVKTTSKDQHANVPERDVVILSVRRASR
jgi:peptidyl-prolyl cis-trans isomerase A (cyclophilin A)